MTTILGPAAGAVLVGLPAGAALAQAPGFHFVGLPPGGATSKVQGLSADGTVATGWSNVPGFGRLGFVWNAAQGRVDFTSALGFPFSSQGLSISADGMTVVGSRGSVGMRLRLPEAPESLGVLAGYTRSFGEGANVDGSVVVGRSETSDLLRAQAFRWTQQGGMQGLGFTRPDFPYSEATAVSRDGGTIVGAGSIATGHGDAFRWTLSGGMEVLPQLAGSTHAVSAAYGVNFNGSIIVGDSADFGQPAMWTASGVRNLGVPPGMTGGSARVVNDDGSVVAGIVGNSTFSGAAVWTQARGPELLLDYLAASGVDLPPGVYLYDCLALSQDGRTFAGTAFEEGLSQGYVVTIPSPPAAALLAPVVGWLSRRRRRAAPVLGSRPVASQAT